MRVSAKTEYACLALMELAARYGQPEPVTIRAIAKPHGIPSRFLVQILLQLKSVGLVASTRGASGGYKLSRPPEEISLGEVMRAIDGSEHESLGLGGEGRAPAARVLQDAWREIAQVERESAPVAHLRRTGRPHEARRREHVLYLIARFASPALIRACGVNLL